MRAYSFLAAQMDACTRSMPAAASRCGRIAWAGHSLQRHASCRLQAGSMPRRRPARCTASIYATVRSVGRSRASFAGTHRRRALRRQAAWSAPPASTVRSRGLQRLTARHAPRTGCQRMSSRRQSCGLAGVWSAVATMACGASRFPGRETAVYGESMCNACGLAMRNATHGPTANAPAQRRERPRRHRPPPTGPRTPASRAAPRANALCAPRCR